MRGSNTYRFYRKGWHGVAIDANPCFERAFSRIRPRDRFVRACVSDEPKEVDFHLFRSSALSSISGNRLYENDEHYTLERVERMRTRRLGEILQETQAPPSFDILSIDVEGEDEKVLRSFDLSCFRPRVILMEMNGANFDIAAIGETWANRYLAANGYEAVAAQGGNLFFRSL